MSLSRQSKLAVGLVLLFVGAPTSCIGAAVEVTMRYDGYTEPAALGAAILGAVATFCGVWLLLYLLLTRPRPTKSTEHDSAC